MRNRDKENVFCGGQQTTPRKSLTKQPSIRKNPDLRLNKSKSKSKHLESQSKILKTCPASSSSNKDAKERERQSTERLTEALLKNDKSDQKTERARASSIIDKSRRKVGLTELCRIIEEVYTANFNKNTMKLKSKKLCGQYISDEQKFSQFLECYFALKEKQKKGEGLPAVLEALATHLQKSSLSNLVVFDKLIAEEFNGDDLLFFLFMRSMVQKQLKINFLKELEIKKSIRTQEDINFITLTKRQGLKISKAIFGDSELASDYSVSLLKFMDQNLIQKIGVYQFMSCFLQQYHSRKDSKSKLQLTLPSQSSNKSQHFPACAESQISHHLESPSQVQESREDGFWSWGVREGELQQLRKDHLDCMRATVQQFLNHLNLQPNVHNQFLVKLFKKTVALLHSVVTSDKLRWFELLTIGLPEQSDLHEVQEVQLCFRKQPRKVFKRILGVRQVRERVVQQLS